MVTMMLDFGFYNMDCMEGMKQFPDKYFDLAVVDPPYGINASRMTMGSGEHLFSKDKDWDAGIPDQQYFEELFRVSKNQVIWGGNYFTEFLWPSKHWLVWDKENPNLSFAEGELSWMNNGDNLRIFHYYTVQAAKSDKKIHPTQKPVELYMWILSKYAKAGDIILDTHVGSASSLIACRETGHKYVGFEIDEEYYRLAKKRLDAAEAQMNILDFIGGYDE